VQAHIPGVAQEKPAYQNYSYSEGGGGGGGGGGGRNGGSGKRPAQTQADRGRMGPPVTAPDYTKAWTGFVEEARARIGQVNGRNLAETQVVRDELLGSEFIALMPSEKPFACASFFLLGRCRPDCPRSHSTTSAPSQQVLAGITDRMKAHCLKLKPKNS
jgi:hypothetical protein